MLINSARTLKLQRKTIAMCFAVPQVMASRIWMLSTSPINSTKSQQEIYTMIAEKQKAFLKSFSDVNSQIISSQMTLARQWMYDYQQFILGNPEGFNDFDKHIDKETIKIMNKGISPYAKTVKANQKRLLK